MRKCQGRKSRGGRVGEEESGEEESGLGRIRFDGNSIAQMSWSSGGQGNVGYSYSYSYVGFYTFLFCENKH